MADVLIYADSLRSPEMRHEVPIGIPDPFLYAERGDERHVVASSFELDRIAEVAPDLQTMPLEEFGLDDLYAQGLSRDEIELEVVLRAARRYGIEQASVPSTFPLEVADHLRANGIQISADREQFVSRRRVKNEAELAGIRRAQRVEPSAIREFLSLAGDPRIRLTLGHVPDDQVQVYLRAADLVALPFRDITNSGSALLALGFDRPVLVPDRGAMGELQALAGSEWVRTYEGELTPALLAHALEWARAGRPQASPPLEALDWSRIAEETLAFYRALER